MLREKLSVAIYKFASFNYSIVVFIPLLEWLLKFILLDFGSKVTCHECENCLPELCITFEIGQVLNCLLSKRFVVNLLVLSLNPGVVYSFSCWNTICCVKAHKFADEISSFSTGSLQIFLPRLKATFLDLLEDLGIAVAIYRWPSSEHNVNNDSNTPNITLLSIVTTQDFWSDVEWCSVHLAHDMAIFAIMVSSTKVNDFQRVVVRFVNDNILRFQITMNDVLSMAIRDGF